MADIYSSQIVGEIYVSLRGFIWVLGAECSDFQMESFWMVSFEDHKLRKMGSVRDPKNIKHGEKRHRDLENTCSARTLQGTKQFHQGSGSKKNAALTKI